MKKVLVVLALAEMGFAAFFFRVNIKIFAENHPLWQNVLAGLPGAAFIIIALAQLFTSANTSQSSNNEVEGKNNELTERTRPSMEQSAVEDQIEFKPADRNANLLRKNVGAKVSVIEADEEWGPTTQLADVSDDNIVSLFTPRSDSSSMAWFVQVRCEDIEASHGPGRPLKLKVLKRHGPEVPLGDVTKWEERLSQSVMPEFTKGKPAYFAAYGKPGSADTFSVMISASADETNAYLLEASTGQVAVGDSEEISKRFLVIHVEYLAAGFTRNTETRDVAAHRLFI